MLFMGAGPDVQAVVWNLECGFFCGPKHKGGSPKKLHMFVSRIVWMGFIRCLVPLVACVCVRVIGLLLVSCLVFFVTYLLRFALTMLSACSTKQSAIIWVMLQNGKLQFTRAHHFMARFKIIFSAHPFLIASVVVANICVECFEGCHQSPST